ncbi:MAG: hypothetical protein H5U11_09450, partial [Rhizobium sp.]|nr:hypothetical protein [Rhizobium sp.]
RHAHIVDQLDLGAVRIEGFFFEIVERRGYQGYGAANAIFRIAALRRHLRPAGMPTN